MDAAHASPHTGFVDPPTDEAAWRRWGEALPELHPDPMAVLVVAPHPDDETLAVGGALADWAAAGVAVTIVTVTDGEGSHPGLPGLADRRTGEQLAALRHLGIHTTPYRLGLPDGGVADHHDDLVGALAALLAPGTGVLAPWELDAHTDHDAAGRAATDAARRTGARLLRYPVWAWQWATPATFAGLAVGRLVTSPAAQAAKARAVACFGSQLDELDRPPILSAEVVAHFDRPWDVVIGPPHA